MTLDRGEVGLYRAGESGGTDTSFVHVQLVRNLPHDKTVFLKYGCIINATVEVVMSWILDGRV